MKSSTTRASSGKRLVFGGALPGGGRPKVDGDKEGAIRQHLAAGTGILKTARTLGVGVSTVQRVKAAMTAAAI